MHMVASPNGKMQRVLQLSMVLTLAYVGATLYFGLRAHSLALISEAGHNVSDLLAIALSFVAVYFQARPATDQRPRHACGDQGPLFDSTGPCSSVCGDVCTAIEPALAAPLCPGEQVPAALELRADRARHLLRRAAAARSERKVRTLVARMLKHLRTSAALAGAAEENGRISRACGAALTRRFSDAQGQAVRWSRTR